MNRFILSGSIISKYNAYHLHFYVLNWLKLLVSLTYCGSEFNKEGEKNR